MRFKSSGFTLIEILVVMVIFTLGASIVFPAIVRSYDKVCSHAEERRLTDILNEVKMRAFFRQTAYTLVGNGRNLKIKEKEIKINFKYIEFSNFALVFNGNGFPNKSSIEYKVQGKEKKIEVL
ncbi:MAG: type II secretion system protein [Desulfobacterales bacterium]|nr:type II secretion system protein [Desulfobacterales bacterium]